MQKKILFLAEAITTAQIVRLKMLSDYLVDSSFPIDIYFASSRFPDFVFSANDRFKKVSLYSISPERMLRAERFGLRLYSKSILANYVRDELRLFDEINPDLVIGDLRFSLPISSKVYGVKYWALINAYWLPELQIRPYSVPYTPWLNLFSEENSKLYFNRSIDFFLKYLAEPMRALRKFYQLPFVGNILDEMSSADRLLHPDSISFFPTEHTHKIDLTKSVFLGPRQWSPNPALLPDQSLQSLNQFIESKAEFKIYLTLGSSGFVSLLPRILSVLEKKLKKNNCALFISTSNRVGFDSITSILRDAPNVYSSVFCDGDRAIQYSNVVVCNGGSSTAYQALTHGKPVIGISSNFDQEICMSHIERNKSGIRVPARSFNETSFEQAFNSIISDLIYTESAKRVQSDFSSYDPEKKFLELIEDQLTISPTRS